MSRVKFKVTLVGFLLALILTLALFFRTYNIKLIHGFAADADLYSWVVKDIVNGHPRLVGQMTSTQGVYAGVGFYYLLAPFFLMTNMDPFAAVIFATFLGLITVWSFYFVFKNILNIHAGLIAAFLQAVLPLRVGFDRWVVPSITINLWCIWFFYSLVKILNGQIKYFVLNLFLLGLVWHVHLSLFPLVVLLPVVLILCRKRPTGKILILGFLAFIIPMAPFFIFELRHQFLQTSSFFNSFFSESSMPLLEKISKVFSQSLGQNFYFRFLLVLLPIILYKIKAIKAKFLIMIYVWIFSVIGFFILSSKESSDYYFTSIQTIFLILFIYLLTWVSTRRKFGFIVVIFILMALFLYSGADLVKQKGNEKGYKQKMETLLFIKADSLDKNFPCFSITYITSPGEDTGFRYLSWFNKIKLEEPKAGIPNYTIVLPYNLSDGSVKKQFGIIGVIPPESGYNLKEVSNKCTGEDFNLSQPLWGYTD